MGTIEYGPRSAVAAEATEEREALVLAHLPQVRLIASRIHDRLPEHVSLDDLISTGVVGLLNAIDNFDPSFNVQLKTYAEHRIRGAIMDSLRGLDWAPRDARKRAKTIQAELFRARQELGREPLEEEIAQRLGIALEEYQKWLAEAQSVEIQRLEQTQSDGEGFDLLSIISDDEEKWPSRIVERKELERILTTAIERMPKNERIVLSLYYYEELTFKEIAEVMGMHLSRVGQLRAQAILRLRSHLERVWTTKGRRA